MREILFRGKRIDNGEWIEGHFGAANGHPYISDEFKFYGVVPETVGQYTGLTDKNGKKIFEGDVLRIAKKSDGFGGYYIPPLKFPVNVIVKWDLCAWTWETICKDKHYISFPDAWGHYESEIIGNAHDNPELMEAEE